MGDEGMTCRRRRWFVVVLMRAVVVFAGTDWACWDDLGSKDRPKGC